jgi:hypothetical protein
MIAATHESDTSTFALDVYWAAGRPPDPALETHLAGCARCRGYLDALDATDAAGPVLRAPVSRPRTRGPRRWLAPAAAAFAVAASVVLALHREGPSDDGRERSYVAAKGTPAVQLLVKRDHAARIWDGRSPVRPGDAVALRVACEGLKHLVVATPSSPGSGAWVRLTGSACPEPGDVLPFTLTVDDAAGEEQLAVVMSRDEMSDEALGRAIAESRRTADAWVVRFALPKETETDR